VAWFANAHRTKGHAIHPAATTVAAAVGARSNHKATLMALMTMKISRPLLTLSNASAAKNPKKSYEQSRQISTEMRNSFVLKTSNKIYNVYDGVDIKLWFGNSNNHAFELQITFNLGWIVKRRRQVESIYKYA